MSAADSVATYLALSGRVAGSLARSGPALTVPGTEADERSALGETKMTQTTVTDAAVEAYETATNAAADFHTNLCERMMGPVAELDEAALIAEGEAALEATRTALRTVLDTHMRGDLMITGEMVRETMAEAFAPVA